MENDYQTSPVIRIWYQAIINGSKEKEVQGLWEIILWTVYPASQNWATVTKYPQTTTEPDNGTMKTSLYNNSVAIVDVLVVELKHLAEDNSQSRFDAVAKGQLNDHMMQSSNPHNTILFGAVGRGQYVQFYSKKLPRGDVTPLHTAPLHLWRDAAAVQEFFNYFKANIPSYRSSSPGLSHESPSPRPRTRPESESSAADPREYYFVQDGVYYLSRNRTNTKLPGCPTNVWVYNELGWSATGRKQIWRLRDANDQHEYSGYVTF